jgi:streptogramin lyase
MVDGLGVRDLIAVDRSTGASWIVGEGSKSIFRVLDSAIREYNLPVYAGIELRCPPPPVDCPDGDLRTTVRGLAVAPNGDLYFSDATMNRIGVIHAGQ